MHTFLDNFHKGGKCFAHIAFYQSELRSKNKLLTETLSIPSLQTDYLNLDSKSGFGRNIERAKTI